MNEETKAIEQEITDIGASLRAELDELNAGMEVTNLSLLARISELIDAKIRLVRPALFAEPETEARLKELETAGAAYGIAYRGLEGRIILLEGRSPSDTKMAEATIDVVGELKMRLESLESASTAHEIAHRNLMDTVGNMNNRLSTLEDRKPSDESLTKDRITTLEGEEAAIQLAIKEILRRIEKSEVGEMDSVDRYDKLVEAATIAEKRLTNLEAIKPSSTITREAPRCKSTHRTICTKAPEFDRLDRCELEATHSGLHRAEEHGITIEWLGYTRMSDHDPEHGNNDSMTGPDEDAPPISLQEKYHEGIARRIVDELFTNRVGYEGARLVIFDDDYTPPRELGGWVKATMQGKIMEILKA